MTMPELLTEMRRERNRLYDMIRTAEGVLEEAERARDVAAVHGAAVALGALLRAAHALDEPPLGLK